MIGLAIISLAILNGGLREKIILPLIGAKYGLSVSGILLCLLIFVLCYFFTLQIGKATAKNYWLIGLLWLWLIIAFEAVFGLLSENTLTELLKAYDITIGNFWLLVVVFMEIALWLAAKTRKLI